MAATWTSVILLAKFNALSGRPSTDSITDALKYGRLSDAQNLVIQDIAPRCPKPLYSHAVAASTPTLTTTDNKIYTFGLDVSTTDAQFPIGKTRIFRALADVPNNPMIEGQDYLNEGNQIRIPNNGTGPATLYWRGMAAVADITASVQPSLSPPPARVLIVYKAVAEFAEEGVRNTALSDRMNALYDRDFSRWCLAWKTQYASGSGFGIVTGLDIAYLYGSGN